MVQDGTEILISSDKVQTGDRIVVRVGNVVPFDGTVVSAGDAMLNQASLTGESVPVHEIRRKLCVCRYRRGRRRADHSR